MRKCFGALALTPSVVLVVLLCMINGAASNPMGSPNSQQPQIDEGAFSKSSGCPRCCNCTSYTATCNSLNFDGDLLPPQFSGLKLIAPLEPLVLSHRIFANLGMGSLVSLIISDSTIIELDEMAFDDLLSLKTVSILNSVMPAINANTFATSNKLKILDLSGTEVPVFNSLVSDTLEELILENCKLNRITESMFRRLPSLAFVNLARNHIEDIHANAFVEQEDLEELILHHNSLKNISFDMFAKNLFIASLDLSHNPITKIGFSEDLELEKLSLNSCQLTEFFDGPSSLSYLDLRNNHVKSFNVGNMPDLQYLYLGHNNIDNISENTFENNTQMITLILDDNPIGKLSPFISANDEQFMLRNLSCRNCGIQRLDPITFETLSTLNSLDLSNNKLEELEKNVFTSLTTLRVLKLAKNKIKLVDNDTLSKNSLLRKLDLSENEIITLNAEAFRHNSKLELLDLSYGRLEKLWQSPTDVKLKITAINAASNPLKDLTLEELLVTPNLEVIDIDNVLVPCTQIKKLLPYLRKNNIGPTIIKTHEDTIDASSDDYDDNHYKSWEEYTKSKGCDALEQPEEPEEEDSQDEIDLHGDQDNNDDFFGAYIDNELANVETDPWNEDTSIIDDADDSLDDSDSESMDFDMGVIRAIEHDRFAPSTYNRFAFLWPTLVFLFTCLLVLMVAVNVFLLVLRKRGALSRNVPQLKTSWGNSNRLLTKRHCGSIYRPLSEDLSGSKTPIISRSLLFTHPANDTPAVHNV